MYLCLYHGKLHLASGGSVFVRWNGTCMCLCGCVQTQIFQMDLMPPQMSHRPSQTSPCHPQVLAGLSVFTWGWLKSGLSWYVFYACLIISLEVMSHLTRGPRHQQTLGNKRSQISYKLKKSIKIKWETYKIILCIQF